MKLKKFLSVIISACLTISCFCFQSSAESQRINFRDINFINFDKRINNGEPIRGVDISSIISLEKAGIDFYNRMGQKQDIFKTLADSGVNYIRVRIWNEPWDSNGNKYGGGNNDLYIAAEIGKRAAKYGMKLLADIQYSDFWADPEKQTRPKYWQPHDHETLKYEIYRYTKWVLETISEAGGDIGMVQVGNETNCFFCGEKDMYKICDLFSSANKAVREFDRSILIAHHFANPSTGYYDWYAKVMNECGLDYDVFATSYYPYWHGTLENLTVTLKKIGDTYNKYVMVAETAYPYTSEDGDTFGNAVSSGSEGAELRYDISVQGQADCLTDVFQAVANVGSKGIGVFYWEPAWIGKSGLSWSEQSELWKKYGSGWATEYAAEYDHSVTGAGGSSYDNQGLFDFNGVPLDSLNVFSHIFPQNKKPVHEDGRYIKSLNVSDRDNSHNWSVRPDLKNGDKVFGDRDFRFTSIPDFMEGTEWISTACDSKKFGSSEAEFTAGEDASVYLGLDTRITDVPEWLNEWKRTEYTMSDNGTPQVTYAIYKKNVRANEKVDLGAISAPYAVNYIVAVGEQRIDPTEPTQPPEPPAETTGPPAETTDPTTETTVSAAPAVPEPIIGDVNADGILDISDAVMLQKWLVNCGEIADSKAADINKDGKINVIDLCIMKRMILYR